MVTELKLHNVCHHVAINEANQSIKFIRKHTNYTNPLDITKKDTFFGDIF